MIRKKFWLTTKTLAAATVALLVTLTLVPTVAGQAKYKNLHTLTHAKGQRATGGNAPDGSLIFDADGNLYGTTERGGSSRMPCGTAFKLSPKPTGRWVETVLYNFAGLGDGCKPYAGLTFDNQGNLYGTTTTGGGGCPPNRGGCGTVLRLTPNADGTWTHTILMVGSGDSPLWRHAHVLYGGVVFDGAGNLYGTTVDFWANSYGSVFKLTPNPDGSWTESVIYRTVPSVAGLIFDATGNLYGATVSDVFKLTPNPDGSWTPNVLYTFTGGADGGSPYAALVFDSAGNLYGTTVNGGAYGHGVVFQLTAKEDGSWTETVLHQFTGGKDGSSPYGNLSFNRAGTLYGTTSTGGAYGYGVVFKLVMGGDSTWRESVVHAFKRNPGAYPRAGVIFDAAGALYGTTRGPDQAQETITGSVFEITP